MMKKLTLKMAGGLVLALAAGTMRGAETLPPVYAQPAPAAAVAPRPVAPVAARPYVAPKRVLAHRFGFGLDSIPGASPTSVLGSVLTAPNAVAVRYWATDKVGIDILGALDMNSIQTGTGTGTPGTVASGFGVGAGVKYNLTQPSHDMLSQVVAKASFASSTQSDATGLVKVNTGTTALFVGAGFEVFVPSWDWLSLEGSLGLSLTSQSVKPESGVGAAAAAASAAAAQSSSRVTLGGTGFSPVNISIHAYF